jgi:hypothetical protein
MLGSTIKNVAQSYTDKQFMFPEQQAGKRKFSYTIPLFNKNNHIIYLNFNLPFAPSHRFAAC